MAQANTAVARTRHDPLMAVLEPALKVGGFSGGAGFLVGGTAGIVRSATPALFATASAIQCSVLGSAYWASRGFILQAWDTGKPHTPSDRTKASALAGGLSGGVAGLLFRGRSNAIPGALCMGLFGAAGQGIFNWWQISKVDVERKPWTWASFVPMKHMTNEEYAEILREKLLKVDVEISILDDKMAALRAQHQTELLQSRSEESPKK